MIVQNISGAFTPFDHEAITVDNTSGGKGFTASKLEPNATASDRDMGKARYIFATLETADARYSIVNGVAPVAATTGHLLEQGSIIQFGNLQAARNFRIIRETGVSATLRVTYFR